MHPARDNKYIDDGSRGFAKDESKKARLATVMYNLLEAVRICTTLLLRVRRACQKIFRADASVTTWDAAAAWGVSANVTVHKGEAIFPHRRGKGAGRAGGDRGSARAALPALEMEEVQL